MLLEDLDILSDKFDYLRSTSNHGEHDKWFTRRLKMTWLIEKKPLHELFLQTYDHPFAQDLCFKEMRLTYYQIRRLLEIKYLQSGRKDPLVKKALDKVNKNIHEITKPKKNLITKLKEQSIPLAALILAFLALVSPYYDILPFVLLLLAFVTIPSIAAVSSMSLFNYLMSKNWHRMRMKTLGIEILRNKMMKELISS